MPDEERERRATRLVLSLGAAAVVLQTGMGLAGGATPVTVTSAAFFTLVPALFAWGLLRSAPRRTTMGRVMSGTTVALLLLAMFLREGAICVLLAAPLVYAVAAFVVWVDDVLRRGSTLAVVLIGLPLLSPTGPAVRHVEVDRVVSADVDTVRAAFDDGPSLAGLERSWLLSLGYPLPDRATRSVDGDAVRWTYEYGRGRSVFAVTETADGLRFEVVEDDAMRRWFAWDDATVVLEERPDGTTSIVLRLGFDPALGPDWWFGTIEGRLLAAAGDHLLDGLGLEVQP